MPQLSGNQRSSTEKLLLLLNPGWRSDRLQQIEERKLVRPESVSYNLHSSLRLQRTSTLSALIE